MNSKKKLAVLGLTVFLFLMQNLSFAQTFQYLENKQKFQLSLPVIATSQINPPPYYTVFIETGNGRYIKNNVSISGTMSTTTPYSYPYPIASGSKAIVTISSYYDETPRPPRNISRPAQNLSPLEPILPDQINLPFVPNKPQKRIKIDPCVDVIVPGDTMAVAITYKPVSAAGTNNIVAFFYNKPSNNGNIIFNDINSGTDYEFNNVERTKAIRKHNDESISSGAIPGGLPQSVHDALDNANENYANALYFLIPAGANDKEKNIFLSLAPTNNTQNYTDSPTSVKATIIQYNGNGIIEYSENTKYELGIGLLSRDPNGIQTSPGCLVDGETSFIANDVTIPHKITFQNDGAGTASKIVVRVSIPKGIKFQQPISAYRHNNKGASILFVPKATGVKNYYELNASTKEIIFTMEDIKLQGTSTQKNITLRRDTISFYLKTEKLPFIIPECMFSDVFIKFFNRDGTANPDVIASDIIRRNCNSTTPCKRETMIIYTKGDPKTF